MLSIRRRRLHIELVDEAGKVRLDPVGVGDGAVKAVCLVRLARSGDAQHFAFGGAEGDHDKIVLIGAET